MMNASPRSVRTLKIALWGAAAILVVSQIASLQVADTHQEWGSEGKAKIRDGGVRPEVIAAPAARGAVVTAAVEPTGFTAQTRLGHDAGDQWESAIAVDRLGHVYMLYPQYGGVPGCADCYNPTLLLQISADHGATWGPPAILYPGGRTTGQCDAQVVVDPVDGRTVYAAWLQNGKAKIAVGKSTDFGASWNVVIANDTNAGTDKPILAARGQDVYVSYNHSQSAYAAVSHDGGATFTQIKINQNAKLGWSLPGGSAITPGGAVFFSWAGYEQSGGAKGDVNLYVSRSTDGGASWTTKLLDVSRAPPDCPAMACGWAYLGAQAVMASDANGDLYALWNAGSSAKRPARIYFAASTNGGDSWSPKAEVSTAPAGTHHNFPAIAATGDGDVRISWMDARAANGGMDTWNVYYRSSLDGGASWSPELDLSTAVSGISYISPDGFRFPYGDYYEIDIDEQGTSHLSFGEGYNYDSPGSTWYVKGR